MFDIFIVNLTISTTPTTMTMDIKIEVIKVTKRHPLQKIGFHDFS